MKPGERYAWIEAYIRSMHFDSVNILDRYFVDAYDQACKPAKVYVMPYGANRIPQLGRDLSAMHTAGVLDRHATGIEGMAGMGFPRWCFSYSLR